mgnify:CR=1 FL=1
MRIDSVFDMGEESFVEIHEDLFGFTSGYRYKFITVNGIMYQTKAISLDICKKACLEFLKKHSVCFTGHRTLRSNISSLYQDILAEIDFFYEMGYRFFFCGGAVGFDMLAAEAVLKYKEQHSDVILVMAVPFKNQDNKYIQADKQRYAALLKDADFHIMFSESYYDRCYLDRNDFMLKHSNALIAYWDGKTVGGTSYTFRKAVSVKSFVIHNLY